MGTTLKSEMVRGNSIGQDFKNLGGPKKKVVVADLSSDSIMVTSYFSSEEDIYNDGDDKDDTGSTPGMEKYKYVGISDAYLGNTGDKNPV